MDCTIYLNVILDREVLINKLKSKFENSSIVSSSIQFDDTAIYVSKNFDYDPEKSKEFPDGFLYFRLFLNIEYGLDDEQYFISIINTLLQFFWNQNIPAIASYDNESLLTEHGGYNNKNLPWEVKLELSNT